MHTNWLNQFLLLKLVDLILVAVFIFAWLLHWIRKIVSRLRN